uniref:Uncharacterized protein n=1 Tax=Meloidogyne floridensis TaxID=298350 RepID=A0A915NXN8_9BILA
MWLFLLLFHFITSFYKNVTPLSVFVKISWREEVENGLDYYPYLSDRQTRRFNLQLTNNTSGFMINAVTDAYDTHHFIQAENDGDTRNQTSGFKSEFRFLLLSVSDIKKNVIIRCKGGLESNFVVSLNKIINGGQQKDEYQSPYVRSNVCPNDEYLLMIFEDGIQQELKCERAIHSSPELNFYQIVFNDQTKKFECKLIGTEHEVAQEYFKPIGFSHVNVDSYMEQYFIEQNAFDVVDDLDPQQRRGGSQRGQKRKGKGTKLTKRKMAQPQQLTNPQQPMLIPDVHQIGQNELSQRMLQFMQLLPRELPQAQHSHQFLSQNPTGICIMDGPQAHHSLQDVPSHPLPNPRLQERGKLPTIQETTEDELPYNLYMDFLQSDYGSDIHLGFQRFMQERGSEQASGHPLGFPSFHTHHGTTQHSQRQQGGSANTEQPHFQGQYPSEGPSSAGDDDMQD